MSSLLTSHPLLPSSSRTQTMTPNGFAGKLYICSTGIVFAVIYWYKASFAPIIDVLQSEFNATSSEIGLMTSLFWFGYVTFQIPSGLVLQYLTAEFTAILSSFLFAVTVCLFSLPFNVNSIIWPGIVMILSGIVCAPIFLTSMKLIAHQLGSNAVPFVGGQILFLSAAFTALANLLQAFLWQEHRMWREMYLGCSVMIFIVFLGMYATELIKKRSDSTSAERYVGLIICAMCIILWNQTINDLPLESDGKTKDEGLGEKEDIEIPNVIAVDDGIDTDTPDGTTNATDTEMPNTEIPNTEKPNTEIPSTTNPNTSVYCCGVQVLQQSDSQNLKSSTSKVSVCKAMKLTLTNPWNWILGFHWFTVLFWSTAVLPLWFVSYMSLKFGYSRETATLINGLFYALKAIGNLSLGTLSTKYKRRKIFYIMSAVGSLPLLYLIYCDSSAHIAVVITCNVIAGFFSGLDSIIFGVVREYNEYFGTSDTASGIVNCLGFLLSGAVMPWVMGSLIDYNWAQRDGEIDEDSGDRIYSVADHNVAFAVMPVVLALNWFIAFLMKETNGEAVQWKDTNETKPSEKDRI